MIVTRERAGERAKLTTGSSRRLWMARVATFFGYLQLGVALDMWSASTLSVQHRLGLVAADGTISYTGFGMVATAIGLGAVIGCFAFGPLTDRWGPRAILWPVYVIFPLSFTFIGLFSPLWMSVVFAVLIGVMRGAHDTATSAMAVGLEKLYDKPLMGGFQAIFPIGGFLGGLLSSHMIEWLGIHDDPLTFYLVQGGLLSLLGIFFGYWTLRKRDIPLHANPESTFAPPRQGRGIGWLIVLFGGSMVMSMWVESAIWDWGPSFGRDAFGVTPSEAALGIGFFSLGSFVGRVACDPLVKRIGPVRTVLSSAAFGVVGLVAMLLLQDDGRWVFTGALFLVGIGVSCVGPIMLSAAGRVDPENSGRSVGLVNGVGYFAMLLCPMVMTVVVSTFGTGGVPVVALVLVLAIIGLSPLMRHAAHKQSAS